MTWIAGLLGMTYAHVIGDLRVAGEDGPIDGFGVAKIRSLSSNSLIGFAGSVPIGLNIVGAMVQTLSRINLVSTFDNNSRVRESLPLRLWMDTWRQAFEDTYSEIFPSEWREDGVEILIVNVSHDSEAPHLPRPRGWILDLPRADEETVEISEYSQLRDVFSIGSGADHDRLVEALREAAAELDPGKHFTTRPDPALQPTDLTGVFIENRLQETVRELLGESGDVGPILVSYVVDANNTRSVTWNDLSSLPPIIGSWPEVANALRRVRTADGALGLRELTSVGEFSRDDQWAARSIGSLIESFDERLRSRTEQILDVGGAKVVLPGRLARIPRIEGFLFLPDKGGGELRFLIAAPPEDVVNGVTYRGSEAFRLNKSQVWDMIVTLNQSLQEPQD